MFQENIERVLQVQIGGDGCINCAQRMQTLKLPLDIFFSVFALGDITDDAFMSNQNPIVVKSGDVAPFQPDDRTVFAGQAKNKRLAVRKPGAENLFDERKVVCINDQ